LPVVLVAFLDAVVVRPAGLLGRGELAIRRDVGVIIIGDT